MIESPALIVPREHPSRKLRTVEAHADIEKLLGFTSAVAPGARFWPTECYSFTEVAILDPALVPLRFNGFRIVSLWQVSHRDQSSESGGRLQMTRV